MTPSQQSPGSSPGCLGTLGVRGSQPRLGPLLWALSLLLLLLAGHVETCGSTSGGVAGRGCHWTPIISVTLLLLRRAQSSIGRAYKEKHNHGELFPTRDHSSHALQNLHGAVLLGTTCDNRARDSSSSSSRLHCAHHGGKSEREAAVDTALQPAVAPNGPQQPWPEVRTYY